MKKLLALVLALVMSMSLVTISNAAFKDGDKVNADYKEAADVMNAIGVFVGDENGNFNATANLTREQAAKIIAYLELGEKAADALVGSAIFTDVAANRWSAGYVGYCAQAGVVNGVGNGAFNPTGELTALQFGKMLLVELGYDAKAAKMVGADWAIATSKLMAKAELMDGIEGSVNQVLTREKAAQMALNALKAPTVEYETKGSNLSINGAELTFGASEPKYVTSEVASAGNISRKELTNQNGYTVELGEKLYPKLVLNNEGDEFERDANKWSFEGKEIGTYEQKATVHYTEKKDSGDIYKDLGLTKATTVSEYYVDGEKQAAILLEKGNTNEKNKVGGQGVDTYVYLYDDGSVRISVMNTYVADVASVVGATATKEAYITLAARDVNAGNTPYASLKNFSSKNTYKTTEFAVDDIVLFNYSNKSGDIGVYNVVKAQTVTGALTNYTVDKQATVGGTVYKYNPKIATEADSAFLNKNVDAVVVLDRYGNAIDLTDNGVTNYAVVLKVASFAGDFNNDQKANLLRTDATSTGVVSLTNNAGASANGVADKGKAAGTDAIVKYGIVSYTINNSKEYTLTDLDDATSANAINISNGSSVFTARGANYYANGKTIFLIKTGTDNDPIYTAYTGIKAVPNVKAEAGKASIAIYCKDGNNVATVVFVDATDATVSVSTSDYVYVQGKTSPKLTVDEVYGNYYTYDAIINGEITTINVAEADGRIIEDTLYNTVSYVTYSDGAKVAKLSAAAKDFDRWAADGPFSATGVWKQNNGSIGLNYNKVSDLYKVNVVPADNCKVFFIDSDGNISASSVSAIATDKDDKVAVKMVNGEATCIVIDSQPKNKGGEAGGSMLKDGYELSGYSDLTMTMGSGDAEYRAADGKVYVQINNPGSVEKAKYDLTIRDSKGRQQKVTDVDVVFGNAAENGTTASKIIAIDFKATTGATGITVTATQKSIQSYYVTYTAADGVLGTTQKTVDNVANKEITFTVNAPEGAAKWGYTIAKVGSTNIAEVSGSDVTVNNLTDATAEVTVKLAAVGTAPVIEVTTNVTDYVLESKVTATKGGAVMAIETDPDDTISKASGKNDYELTVVLKNGLGTNDKVVVKWKLNGADQTDIELTSSTGERILTKNGIDLGSSATKATTVEITSVTVLRAISYSGATVKDSSRNLTTNSAVKVYKVYDKTTQTEITNNEAFAVGTKLYVEVTGGVIDAGKKVTYTLDGVSQTTGDATEKVVFEYTVQDKDNITFGANVVEATDPA